MKKNPIKEPINFDTRDLGEQTRKLLKKKKIKSPDTSILIEVAPNIKIAPKVKFKTKQEKQDWINEMKLKYTK